MLVEGESDCWTGWLHELPLLGVPGKATWRPEWASYLEGLDVYVWQEPDAEDFTARIARDVPNLKVIAGAAHKDLNAALVAGEPILQYVTRSCARARSWTELECGEQNARRAEYLRQARPVLDHPDPLEMVTEALRTLGYGGPIAPPKICYLAMPSRLLKMYQGGMPVHLLVLGNSGSGKNYTVSVTKALLPPDCVHEIKSGSARVVIYDDADLRHRVLVYGEADSLPSGDEDNPAASAIRALLQDHELSYDVTERDSKGNFVARKIRRPGPTVLITTSTRRLRDSQMMTRVFELEVPEDREKNRASLKIQARNSECPPANPNPALIAFQAYLQLCAPWSVSVPYAAVLAELIGQSSAASESRVNRDFAKILSFVKSVALLRHASRTRDTQGWVVATIEDYRTVYDLVGEMFQATVSGASEGVRRVVAAVGELAFLEEPCNLQRTFDRLGPSANKGSVQRWVRRALDHGWLVNHSPKEKSYDLALGEPIPEKTTLPSPEAVATAWLQVARSTGQQAGVGLGTEEAFRV
jgi:hypothetical protein